MFGAKLGVFRLEKHVKNASRTLGSEEVSLLATFVPLACHLELKIEMCCDLAGDARLVSVPFFALTNRSL